MAESQTMVSESGAVLIDVIAGLDTAVHSVPVPPDPAIRIRSVSMVDADDLAHPRERFTDAILLVGVAAVELEAWLTEHRGTAPAAVLAKVSGDDAALARQAAASGSTLIVIDPRARWDQVLGSVQSRLDRYDDDPAGGEAVDVDLFGLVGLIAQGTGGLVSIEDATSARVLAYSPSKGEADDLRVQTILGRAGPPAYLELLRAWGVFDAIRRGGEVVDVPEHPDQHMRRRLVVGVHSRSGRHLGSIWVQEGGRSLADDAAEVLHGAAAIAARILTREMQAPSTEGQLVQRVFGAHGGVDPSTAAAYLRLSVDESVGVVGVAVVGGDEAGHADAMSSVGGALRLHASAFAPAALTTVLDERAYILLPATSSPSITRWVRGLVSRFDGDPALGGALLRAAVVAPIAGLADVPAARIEVDRVLTATAGDPERVTSLAESRTAVLLGEILDAIAARDDLADPRVTVLADYDARHDGGLVPSVRAYLDAHGNVRDAAKAVGVHANTLRYRIERAQQLSGLRFDDPADRLLTTIQLAVLDRG
ncbi:MAG: helix-turn-helix domain-containing protein [Gordonia sp. (in: high G+C Gram-positive bacteria)]|uniref:PucR family transcriptional regulator n=2 Tax=Gordoniaceae TaxID=85026 RepID=UPI003C781B6E